MSFLLALVVAVIGVVPLVFARKLVAAAITGVVALLLLWFLFFCGLPSLVWPLWGWVGGAVFTMWVVSAVIYGLPEDSPRLLPWPLIALLIFMGRGISGCSLFRASDYNALLGEAEKREWTQDVQPKDPKHIRLVPQEMAEWLANKQLGEAPGAIGSQFQVCNDHMTLQRIQGELWYVAPLDFKGFKVWQSVKEAPGYVMVHAEDPLRPVIVKTDQHFKYTPGAYWGSNLNRYLWSNGYLWKGLTDFSLEIDEEGRAWWVVTVFKPTIAWSGKKAEGIVLVNPAGEGTPKYCPINEIPSWVDRVVPQDYVSDYIANRGQFHSGWWNSAWIHKDIIEPETPTINYGSDGEPYWVTTVTSNNVSDESMVGLYYTDVRTGRSVFYHAIGGTEAAILTAVNNKISYKNWHGAGPVLYNMYGTMASIVPLLGVNHTFQGVAFVKVDNLQVALGDDQYQASREYQKLIFLSGQQFTPEVVHNIETRRGAVDRFAQEVKGGETKYYLHLAKFPHLFTGVGELSPELPITTIGDSVVVVFINSKEDVMPLEVFDNLNLPLESTISQEELRAKVATRQEEVREHREARDVKVELEKMSDKELIELLKDKEEKQK